MKKLIFIFCLLFIGNSFSQSNEKIKFLDYANTKIEVPKNCTAKSKYELLNCDGISAQWLYFQKTMLKSVAEDLITQFSEKSDAKDLWLNLEGLQVYF